VLSLLLTAVTSPLFLRHVIEVRHSDRKNYWIVRPFVSRKQKTRQEVTSSEKVRRPFRDTRAPDNQDDCLRAFEDPLSRHLFVNVTGNPDARKVNEDNTLLE
jgi:hypothetical protein